MNVYVRALASALARAGVECDVYTRAEDADQPRGGRGRAGLPGRARHRRSRGGRSRATSFPILVDDFVDETARILDAGPPVEVLHANYWLSGAVAHQLKHARDFRWSRPSTRLLASRPTPASTTTPTSARGSSTR